MIMNFSVLSEFCNGGIYITRRLVKKKAEFEYVFLIMYMIQMTNMAIALIRMGHNKDEFKKTAG